MITRQKVIETLERWAPPLWADSYDTVGLLWGDPTRAVSGILASLDLTPSVVEEAQAVGADFIVVHHPIWFGQKSRLAWDSYADKLIYDCIRADIAVYAMHTNLDHAQDGVSYALCRALSITPEGFLRPANDHGAGYIGSGTVALGVEDFLKHVQRALSIPALRYARGRQTSIQRIAVCGGAGSFLLPEAIRAGVDAFLTADIPYHRFFEAQGHLWLIDIGHYESEVWIADQITAYLKRHFPELSIFSTRIRTNPVEYWL